MRYTQTSVKGHPLIHGLSNIQIIQFLTSSFKWTFSLVPKVPSEGLGGSTQLAVCNDMTLFLHLFTNGGISEAAHFKSW